MEVKPFDQELETLLANVIIVGDSNANDFLDIELFASFVVLVKATSLARFGKCVLEFVD